MKYIKRNEPIEAIQWRGHNFDEIVDFAANVSIFMDANKNLVFQTENGEVHAPLGSYIVKGMSGDIYPVKPEIFENDYIPYKEPKTWDIKCDKCGGLINIDNRPLVFDGISNKYKYWTTCPYCKHGIEWEIDSND